MYRLTCLALALACPALPAAAPAKADATHKQVKEIAVTGDKPANKLQTLCLSPGGNVLALVAPPRYGAAAAGGTSEVHAFDADGKQVAKWAVDFTGQSINAGPDGVVYVAGDGVLAKFDKAGKQLARLDIPHIAAALKDRDKMLEQAKKTIEENVKSYTEEVKSLKEQKKELEAKKPEDLTAREKTLLRTLDQQVKTYEQFTEQQRKQTPEAVMSGIASRLKVINAVAATERDVFIACGETKGYGYSVWRMTADLKEPKQILTGLGGCCGQMDVQAAGDNLYVAENTRHKVGHYDRDGKKLGAFGKEGRGSSPECFGGCCNPMNVRVGPNGNVYTAESEGHVKVFTPKGEFAGTVGTATLKGGCKNVALAVSADGGTVYFCDQPGSRILVLARKTDAKGAE